jgi:GTP-binding protein
VKTAYKTIRGELAAYAEELAEKPEIVVLNKIDALDPDEAKEKVKVLKRASKAEVLTCLGRHRRGRRQGALPRHRVRCDADKAEREELERRKSEPTWVP